MNAGFVITESCKSHQNSVSDIILILYQELLPAYPIQNLKQIQFHSILNNFEGICHLSSNERE